MSNVPPRPTPLQATIEKLARPVHPGADPTLAQVQLDEQRQRLLEEAKEMALIWQELDIQTREYNIAHGFTSVANHPSRIGEIRQRGKNLNAEISRDGRARSSAATSHMSAERPKYSSHVKNLRAARAAAAELSGL